MKRYLLTMDHNKTTPINHGLVDISNDGLVNGETPVEDFGMYIISDQPFPDCKQSQFDMFIKLLTERE